MHPFLQQARQAIEEAVHGMNREQLQRHPEGKWSTAEVLEHLSIAFGGTMRGLRRCLEAGKPGATPPSLYQRLGKLLVVDVGYFPPGRPAPEFTRPRGMDPEQVLPQLLRNLEDMDRALAECEQKFGRSLKVADHPVLGAFTVDEWRKFHLIHSRHHMKQVARLRKMAAAASVQ